MNKKIVSGIMLCSTLVLSVSTVAINCSVKQNTEKNEPILKKIDSQKEINDVANNVELDYPNKENLISDKVDIKMVNVLNLDKNKYDVMLKNINFDSMKKLVWVIFSIKNKETKLISTEVSKQIEGFNGTKISVNNLNSEVVKVVVDYPEKWMIQPDKTNKKSFVFSGYDTNKFKILLTEVTPNNLEGRTTIHFKVVDINFDNNESDVKEISLNGFKSVPLTLVDLVLFANELKLDYLNKENIYPWEAKWEKIIITNSNPNIKIKSFELTGINPYNSNAIVTFFIYDNLNPKTIIHHSLEINGFKKLPKKILSLYKKLKAGLKIKQTTKSEKKSKLEKTE